MNGASADGFLLRQDNRRLHICYAFRRMLLNSRDIFETINQFISSHVLDEEIVQCFINEINIFFQILILATNVDYSAQVIRANNVQLWYPRQMNKLLMGLFKDLQWWLLFRKVDSRAKHNVSANYCSYNVKLQKATFIGKSIMLSSWVKCTFFCQHFA